MIKKTIFSGIIGFMFVATGCAGVNNVSDATSLINNKLRSATDAVNGWVGPLSRSGNSDWKRISERVDYTNINETKLNGLFSKNPYDEKIDPEFSYPRVALTVHDVPDNHDDIYPIGMPGRTKKLTIDEYEEIAGCWDLSATVWENSTDSETIDFGWCYPDDQDGTIHGRLVYNWVSFSGLSGPKGGHTGLERTTGPLPPRTKFPDNLAHKKFLGDMDQRYNTIMLGSIMDTMGFDYTITEDKRFWVVRFDQAR